MEFVGADSPLGAASAPSFTRRYRWTDWSDAQAAAFGGQPLVCRHRLHEGPLFSDAALLDLIANYPRHLVQVFTMGTDPTRREDWMPVDAGSSGGREIWNAIARGRLWFKLLRVHAVDTRYRDLIDELYAELADRCVGFRPVRTYGTLLVSSPTALVYYHADAQPNMLWHLRGSKRVWVYPSGDRELISQDLLEDIFASYVDEEAPYDPAFDGKALAFDLEPGDVISWPQNAPHRVTNLRDVNVSLSTLHETTDSDRRKTIYCANRLLRRDLGLPVRSVNEHGALPYCKSILYRAFRRLGYVTAPPPRSYSTNLQLEGAEPTGYRMLPGPPVLTQFSKGQPTSGR